MTAPGDWWTRVSAPYTGCRRLALPPAERPPGCRACWLPGQLARFPAIHGGAPGTPQVHPQRLAAIARTRAPQRYGWILGEPADVDPAWLLECLRVVGEHPRHGVGVLTSSPERLDPLFFGNGPKPQNVVWLVSASTVSEMNQRWLALRALGHAGWRVGWHLEPLLGDVAGSLGAGGALASLAWIVSGAPRGEESGREAYDWHRRIRDAAARLGVPFWMKSLGRRTGRRLDGVEHNALPAGWPAVTL